MLQEILDLGFDRVELGHGIRLPLLEGILAFAETGRVRFTSLHNFCPLPVEVGGASPDCYELTSHRADDRQRAVRLTRQTIDNAVRLGAPLVVMHLGYIRSLNFTRGLIALARSGTYLSREYTRNKLRAVIRREAAAPHILARLHENLAPIVDYASARGVTLAFENRDAYEAVPSEREFPEILDRYFPHAGYWHDFGHAQIKENLSFLDHGEWLSAIGPRTIGCHLHDASWPNGDHLPPFEGSIDFARLVPLLPRGIPYVMEMHPSRSAESIRLAAGLWRQHFES